MLMAYSQDVFPNDYVPTVFDNFVTSIVVNGKPIRLGLWDTAGQEDYARLRMVSYPMTVSKNLTNIGGRWYYDRAFGLQRLKNESLYNKILLLQKFNDTLGQVLKHFIFSL